ncbi:helix-turn-helix domain-containing protein [Curtobacterium luteum]|uniref:helix-turn-helix domain-containing protein n=1 Tax=Curtobacterium luteum TaxID=33881 RepID=UPI0037FC1469
MTQDEDEARHGPDHIDDALGMLGPRLAKKWQHRTSRTTLAARTGIDLGTLKRIEKRQVPSLSQLLRLSEFLGISPWEALGGERFTRPRDRARTVQHPYGSWQLIVDGFTTANPVELELDAGIAEPHHEHDGAEWLYVVKGTVLLHLAGGDPIELRARDAVDFDGAIPHHLVNDSGEQAVILRRMSADGLEVHLSGGDPNPDSAQ